MGMDGNAAVCAEACIPVEKLWTLSNDTATAGDCVWVVWKTFSVIGRMGVFHVEHLGPIQPLISPWVLSRRIAGTESVPRGTSVRKGTKVPSRLTVVQVYTAVRNELTAVSDPQHAVVRLRQRHGLIHMEALRKTRVHRLTYRPHNQDSISGS